MLIHAPTPNISHQTANDRMHSVLWGIEAEKGSFRCECGRPSCTEKVEMTSAEYVRLRDRKELVYAPGHDNY